MMGDLFKLIKLILKVLPIFRDVTQTYKQETGKDKPAFLSQRVWGATIAGVTALLTGLGITLDADYSILDKIRIVADSIWQIFYILKDGIQNGDFTLIGSILDVNYPAYVALFIGLPLFYKGAKNAIQRKKEVAQ
jgi:hypothetical protein